MLNFPSTGNTKIQRKHLTLSDVNVEKKSAINGEGEFTSHNPDGPHGLFTLAITLEPFICCTTNIKSTHMSDDHVYLSNKAK